MRPWSATLKSSTIFPSRSAYAKREHRWVRGDWQLLPWLTRNVPVAAPEATPGSGKLESKTNALPFVERWKIFDNLRRSLTPASLVALFVLGWTVLPGSPWLWTAIGLTALFLPLLLYSKQPALFRGRSMAIQAREIGINVASTAGQAIVMTSFLVHQAATLLDAVIRTLWRLVISRRNLLELGNGRSHGTATRHRFNRLHSIHESYRRRSLLPQSYCLCWFVPQLASRHAVTCSLVARRRLPSG